MSNDFFGNHPFLGNLFDFDKDGSLDLGEASFMGAAAMAYRSEMERASRKAERERRSWYDDDYKSDDR